MTTRFEPIGETIEVEDGQSVLELGCGSGALSHAFARAMPDGWRLLATDYSDELVAHAEKKLGVKLGGTTGDGRITLVREEECLAGCCGAPMAVVDGHYKEHIDIEKLDALLDGLE